MSDTVFHDRFDPTNGHTHDGTPGNGPEMVVGAADNTTLTLTEGVFAIKDGGVGAAKLAANAVETAKIKDANVTTAKLATDAVETVKIKAGAVTKEKINADFIAANVTCAADADAAAVRTALIALLAAITAAGQMAADG